MTTQKLFNVAAAVMTVAVGMSLAAGVPGKDRPIRVGMYKGTGSTRYWHTNIQTAATAIKNFLESPTTTNLGANLIVPTAGFTFQAFGCNTENCTPTATDRNNFIAGLDTLDVIYIGAFVEIGNSLTAGVVRDTIYKHIMKKGYVASHATTDSYGTWPALDSVHAARFQNHPNADRVGTLRLDTVGTGGATGTNSSWKFLNAGLADTAFTEEWFSYTTNANVIRAYPNLVTTVNIDEASYVGGLGGARQMGADHPMSWYRTFPTGGRFFYTGVGHRVQNFQGGANPRFLRRQLYNAFLWTAGYDTTGGIVAIRNIKATGPASDYSRLAFAPGSLTVTLIPTGNHTVELLTLDGKRAGFETGDANRLSHSFSNLRPGLYAVSVSTMDGRSNRLVTIE